MNTENERLSALLCFAICPISWGRLVYEIPKSFSGFYYIFSEFLAKSAYVYIHGSGEHIGVEFSPDFFQEDLTIDGSSPILSQVLNQVEFFCGEIHYFGIFCHQTFRCIDFHILDLDNGGFIGNASPSE